MLNSCPHCKVLQNTDDINKACLLISHNCLPSYTVTQYYKKSVLAPQHISRPWVEICCCADTRAQCQVPVNSGSLYQCKLHCSVLGRPLGQLQSVPAHNFSFIAVNSINRCMKIIIKLSNVIIHIQTWFYLDLSVCVQVEHVRKICVRWCIVHSSTFYIRGLLIKHVYDNILPISFGDLNESHICLINHALNQNV
jgi:hypothetical protein